MMEILSEQGRDDLAKVYVAKMRNSNNNLVEFVESIQPPIPREDKWVLIVSTLFGCPVNCKMCDAGRIRYSGKLTSDEILSQINYMVEKRFPDKKIPSKKFKIQFARMGDPALNMEVLTVLEKLPEIYDTKSLIPSISTIGPKNSEEFFEKLIEIKDKYYSNGNFQFQFSIHTTDVDKKNDLIPVKTLSFQEMADYGERFYKDGDLKITLNFAMGKGYPVDVKKVRHFFNPEKFLIKLTPINPTENAKYHDLVSEIDAYNPKSAESIVNSFKDEGFDVILSIGEVEENKIGSNCGMFVSEVQKRL